MIWEASNGTIFASKVPVVENLVDDRDKNVRLNH